MYKNVRYIVHTAIFYYLKIGKYGKDTLSIIGAGVCMCLSLLDNAPN